MGKVFSEIDERNAEFIHDQKVFFVATAPSGSEGHVNLSPKGLPGSLAILGPLELAYLDLVGSGAETVAHARDNGRIVIMFCAFEGPPRILRLHGRAEVLEPGDGEFDALIGRFAERAGNRAIIRVRVERIADSCGYGVPRYRFLGERDQLPQWARRKGPEGLADYKAQHNRVSLDGLPALRRLPPAR